ncbi:hypothetical protein PVAND_017462 [Polypedilum vanderplanki]|uniref:Arrestin C-terminal-like domain-containing protein n=1 Tax=Polypedilum vanderplanki TaxID=319348 RepID=A0A9J6BJ41_POLVA|nr:hypothetical protein PVAND_017462 [Polypedilum vanderplanki]
MKCEIELRQQQNRVFVAGEEIDGFVVLKLNQNTIINEVSIQILGHAKCTWSIDSSVYYMQSYHGKIEHLNANLILLHKPINGQAFLSGTHKFNFFFQLPETLPASFNSLEGCVKYKMIITVKRFAKSNSIYEYPFLVTRHVDLNEIIGLDRPLLKVTAKEFTIDFTSKSLYMSAMISQQGFVPHQIIDVRTQIDNRSIVYVKYVKISLKKITIFTSQSPQIHSKKVESTKAVAYCGDVPAHEKRMFMKYLKIPLLSPNISNCDIIKVSYEIQVKAKSIGVTRSPTLRLPIQIGTTPLIRDSSLDYEMDMPLPRLEIAPMSYEECMAMSTPESIDTDLIDFNLPTYDEAINQNRIRE